MPPPVGSVFLRRKMALKLVIIRKGYSASSVMFATVKTRGNGNPCIKNMFVSGVVVLICCFDHAGTAAFTCGDWFVPAYRDVILFDSIVN